MTVAASSSIKDPSLDRKPFPNGNTKNLHDTNNLSDTDSGSGWSVEQDENFAVVDPVEEGGWKTMTKQSSRRNLTLVEDERIVEDQNYFSVLNGGDDSDSDDENEVEKEECDFLAPPVKKTLKGTVRKASKIKVTEPHELASGSTTSRCFVAPPMDHAVAKTALVGGSGTKLAAKGKAASKSKKAEKAKPVQVVEPAKGMAPVASKQQPAARRKASTKRPAAEPKPDTTSRKESTRKEKESEAAATYQAIRAKQKRMSAMQANETEAAATYRVIRAKQKKAAAYKAIRAKQQKAAASRLEKQKPTTSTPNEDGVGPTSSNVAVVSTRTISSIVISKEERWGRMPTADDIEDPIRRTRTQPPTPGSTSSSLGCLGLAMFPFGVLVH